MNLIRLDPSDQRSIKHFLDLLFQLYADTPQWVPPLEMDVAAVLNPKKHPFYSHITKI